MCGIKILFKSRLYIIFYILKLSCNLNNFIIYFVSKDGQKGKGLIYHDFSYVVLIKDGTQVEKKIDKKGEIFDWGNNKQKIRGRS